MFSAAGLSMRGPLTTFAAVWDLVALHVSFTLRFHMGGFAPFHFGGIVGGLATLTLGHFPGAVIGF